MPDTKAKRRSVPAIGRKHMGPRITNDATPDNFWRQAVARSYTGIASAISVIVTAGVKYVRMYRNPAGLGRTQLGAADRVVINPWNRWSR